jgi:polyisoprenoid-binding protein YceI
MSTPVQQIPAGIYAIDPIHSSISHSIKAAGLAGFRSSFSVYDGGLQHGVLLGSAELDSMQIAEEQLKGMLLSPAFFDADQFPNVSVKSDVIRVGTNRAVELEGD